MITWLIIYSSIYVIMGFMIMWPIAKPWFRNKLWYAFVLWGVLSFEITLVIQPVIQMAYLNLINFTALESNGIKLLLLLPNTAISGFFQELLKVVPVAIWYKKTVKTENHTLKNLLAFALASGFGFGVWEAIRLAAWPVAQLTAWLSLPVYERFMAILLHGSATALIAYGLTKRQGLRYYFIASLLHTLVNFGIAIFGLGYWSQNWIYISGTFWAGLSWVLAYRMWKQKCVEMRGEIA